MDRDLQYARIAQLVFNRPLAATTEAAQSVADFLARRMDGGGHDEAIEIGANRFVGETARDVDGTPKGYRLDMASRTGIVSIIGELVNRGAWIGASSGLTSYEGVITQAQNAMADPNVDRILIDINSPGGEALGMIDAARTLRATLAGKPSIAVINSMAASAAYGLAAAADEIVIGEGGVAGSIGGVLIHMDQSERMANAGVKPTVIAAGDLKALGNPFEALSSSALTHLTAQVQDFTDAFCALVADLRGLEPAAVRAQQSALYDGADAVAAGLADRVGTFESVLAERTGADVPAQQRRLTMAETTETQIQAGISQSAHDLAVNAARAEGEAAGSAMERDRIGAIAGAEGIGANLGAAIDLAMKSPDMAADDVVAFCASHVTAGDPDYIDHKTRASGTEGLRAIDPKKPEDEKRERTAGLSAAREKYVDRMEGKRARHA